LQDKLESLQTLKSLLEKNMELFSANLKKSTNGKSFVHFEQDYIKEISPIVQVLVMTAHADLEKDPEYKSLNEAIINLGKRIGELASEMIRQVSSLKKIDTSSQKKWLTIFQKKTDEIGAIVKKDLEQVDSRIKAIQSPVK
jgi:hypothetical protein